MHTYASTSHMQGYTADIVWQGEPSLGAPLGHYSSHTDKCAVKAVMGNTEKQITIFHATGPFSE